MKIARKKTVICLLLVLMMQLILCQTAYGADNEAVIAGLAEGKEYEIDAELSGGSGRAGITTPARLTAVNGSLYVEIEWSSPYYEFMIVDGETYYPVNEGGNSAFLIPVLPESTIEVSAQTIAMSEPHLVDYTITFGSVHSAGGGISPVLAVCLTAAIIAVIAVIVLNKKKTIRLNKNRKTAVMLAAILMISTFAGCGQTALEENDPNEGSYVDIGHLKEPELGNGMEPVGRTELVYAGGFRLDTYEDGSTLISVTDGSRYLVVPEGVSAPEGVAEDIKVLHRPIENIYLAASSVMCLFDALDGLSQIKYSGIKQGDWYVENARSAMESGDMIFGGKYNMPDYELLLSGRCGLAVESTMINHKPEVREQLETIGIPVFVDLSSYEAHPLGRTEWIKLYAVLLGKEAEASEIFEKQQEYLETTAALEPTGRSVAFFHISSSGYVVTRKSGDYISKMIELAGGRYVFSDLGDPDTAKSTVNMEMESFYAAAKDADIIIYNSTIDGEISSIDELIAKNSLLAEFKAVKEGSVWCTGKNMFQETTQLGKMVAEFHEIFSGESDDTREMSFLYKLQDQGTR